MVDESYKIEGTETKVLLRHPSHALPKVVSERKGKLGFATPEGRWFTEDVRRALCEEIAKLGRYSSGIFNAGALKSFAAEMATGRRPLGGLGWRLAALGVWSRECGLRARSVNSAIDARK